MTGTNQQIRAVCVYCGSQPGRNTLYVEAGRTLGRAIALSGLRLVYGGGTRGVMGAVAEGAMEVGGAVTGIIPEFLMEKEATRRELARLDELVVTHDMHERKHTMFERADAFVTLPGGIGTLEEIIEIMTWAQLGRHAKPIVMANIAGFWAPLTALMNHMREEGFLHTAHLVQPLVVDDIEDAIPAILDAAQARQNGGEQAIIDRM